MIRHNISDANSQYENDLNTSNFYSCLAMSHSKNAAYTTPKRSTIRRYSLANTWHSSSPIQQKGIQGEVHVSPKIDGDSPIYSTRVLHDKEDQRKPLPTHHSKYDKLGVFPIVHFFKKELPFLKRKVHKVHSSNHSSEISKFNSPAHNRLLLEKIIKSSSGNQEIVSNNHESNTKSVLDALKEISGKRIHTDEEEYIVKEDGKRIYVDYDGENNLSKRVKQNSQIEDSTLTTSPIRTPGLLNELMASCSSMDEYSNEEPKKPRFNGQTNTALKAFTPAQCVDVETQTSESHVPIISEAIGDSKKTIEEDVNLNNPGREARIKKVSPINIFDETPLEIMRKNRLTALMGSLTANQDQNKIESTTLQSEDKSRLDKPLVSILAGNTKNLHKSVKHVTFDIPEVVNSTDGQSNTKTLLASKDISNVRTETDITKTSVAISSPIVSASITESRSPRKLSLNPMNDLPSLLSSTGPLVDQNKKNESSEVHFRDPLPSSQVTESQNLGFGTNTVDKDMNEKNNVNASTINEDVEIKLSKVHGTEFPAASQAGGFKFQLKEVTSTTTPTTAALFTFTTPTTYSNAKSTVSSNQENSNIFNDTSNINQSFGIPSVGPFSMNRRQTSSTSSGVSTSPLASNTFGQPAVTSHISSTFTTNFNKQTSAPNFNTCSTSTSKPTSFSFVTNSQSTTTTASNLPTYSFGSHNSSLKLFDNIKNPLNFSVATTPISLSFNVQTSACPTTIPLTSSNKEFVTSNSSTSAVFSESTSKAPPMNNFFFTEPDNSFTKKSSFENQNNAPAGFGNSKTMFGHAPKTSFCTTAPASFANNGGNTVGTSAFENVKTATTSIFTTTNNFPISSDLPAYGANTNSNFAPNNFGITEKSNFGGNLNSEFKHNASSSFGSPFNNTFGINTNTCGFATNVSAARGTSKSFDSNKGFAQTNSITPVASFGTNLPFEKSTDANTTETTPFGSTKLTFGPNNFGANPQNPQNNLFTFGNKPAVFSFGTNETHNSPFNFQTETNANIFGNKNLSDNQSSTNSQFNLQQTGANMFNIGTGTSTPNRLRIQHKAKRRT